MEDKDIREFANWILKKPLSHQQHLDPLDFSMKENIKSDKARQVLEELKNQGFLFAKIEIECPRCEDRFTVDEEAMSRIKECSNCGYEISLSNKINQTGFIYYGLTEKGEKLLQKFAAYEIMQLLTRWRKNPITIMDFTTQNIFSQLPYLYPYEKEIVQYLKETPNIVEKVIALCPENHKGESFLANEEITSEEELTCHICGASYFFDIESSIKVFDYADNWQPKDDSQIDNALLLSME